MVVHERSCPRPVLNTREKLFGLQISTNQLQVSGLAAIMHSRTVAAGRKASEQPRYGGFVFTLLLCPQLQAKSFTIPWLKSFDGQPQVVVAMKRCRTSSSGNEVVQKVLNSGVIILLLVHCALQFGHGTMNGVVWSGTALVKFSSDVRC